MSDISKCIGKDCPIKEKCYRFTSPRGVWQYWQNYKYEKDNKCEGFYEIVNK